MRKESEFCTVIKNSMIDGFKIPDPSTDFTQTIQRSYDGIGLLPGKCFPDEKEEDLIFIPWEAKFFHTSGAFSFKNVREHQDYYLSAHGKASHVHPLLIVGYHLGRGDLRAYVFDYKEVGHILYQSSFSIHKKYLDKLPYNKVSKGLFSFEHIIRRDEMSKAYEEDIISTLESQILQPQENV